MELKACLMKILEDAEKTLDMATGETPESRAAAKEKFKRFIKNLTGSNENDGKEDEKK